MVPPALIGATTRAAVRLATGGPGSVGVSAAVAELTEGVLSAMLMTKWKTAAVLGILGLAATATPLVSKGTRGAAAGPPPEDRRPGDGSGARPGATSQDAPLAMTLDDAIARAVRENSDLRAKFSEIPQARADVLNAGLRSNPVFYADGQIVPYGRYTKDRPGGQTQYDVNVSYPLDLSRKRLARQLLAARPKRVIEAQYQDAVRLVIDSVSMHFVDVQEAQEKARLAGEALADLDRLLSATEARVKTGDTTDAALLAIKGRHELARLQSRETKAVLERTRRGLGTLLHLSEAEADRIEAAGTLQVRSVPLPSADELVRVAMDARPDVNSRRLAIQQEEEDEGPQPGAELPDSDVVDHPSALQDRTPSGSKDSNSRPPDQLNQGGIARAEAEPKVTKITTSRLDLALREQRVASGVRQAHRECESRRVALRRVEDGVLPMARRVRDDVERLYEGGKVDVTALLESRRDFQDVERAHLDLLVRHRKGCLGLNTAVGLKILP
jgi:cobalt-zinc-cadmium efflux system outer membrane protein